jgi:hypothetical protein
MSSARADSISINFDVDSGGTAITAPATFDNGSPLHNLYAPLGVHFTGSTPDGGGYILNDSTFTTKARSGSNFLAFSFGLGPETVTFDTPLSSASIFVSSLSHIISFEMDAFDAGGALLDSDTLSSSIQGYNELSVASPSGIKKIVLSVVSNPGLNSYVFDDFFATAVPEPSSFLLFAGGGIIFWFRRRPFVPMRRDA